MANHSSSFALNDISPWFERDLLQYLWCKEFHLCWAGHIYQTNPLHGDNKVSYTPPKPEALYNCSFCIHVGDGNWTDNYLAASGHLVTVEYTIQYQHNPFQFEVNEIIATSNHPIHNSCKELIMGKHTLWKRSNPSNYVNGNHGLFQPNIFAYKFGTSFAENGILDVKVWPLDTELIGTEVILLGTIDGQWVIQSDYFKNLNEVTVQAHVITPTKSVRPFSLNHDVDWGMELRLSNKGLQCVREGITRLELYWIATTLHLAFKAYIPVTFLHNALQSGVTVHAGSNIFEFYQDMAARVFTRFMILSKVSCILLLNS